jgi:hypothetical protein
MLFAGVAETRGDSLLLTAQVQNAPQDSGKGGGFEWLWTARPHATLNGGAYVLSVGGANWRYGRVGVTLVRPRGASLFLQADIGSGRDQATAEFTYQIYRGSLTRALGATGLSAEAEDQYIHVGRARGHVARLGGAYSFKPAVTARLAYHGSIGGNLGARYMSARIDVERHEFSFLAGAVAGHSRADVTGLFSAASLPHSREIFAGVRIVRPTRELILVLSTLRLGGVDRYSLTLAYRMRL